MASVVAAAAKNAEAKAPLEELRGVWITNVDSDMLASRQNIAKAMDYLKKVGINVVYPVVYNGGMTLYPSAVMEKEFGVSVDPRYAGRDLLQEILFEGHRNGLEVIPWFEYGFASSYNNGGGFILEQHPEWAAIDQDGALVKKNGFEWLNAFDPEVQNYITALMMEVADKYDVDGIQGDDRLPALPTLAGYDAKTVAKFKAEKGKEPPKDITDAEWVKWRANLLTDYLAALKAKLKDTHPSMTLSLAPSPYDWGLQEYLQDSKEWMNRGLPETMHPQCYRHGRKEYFAMIDQLASQYPENQRTRIFPGMLINLGKDYLITKQDLTKEIAYNRKNGFAGEVFFFAEGLRKNDDSLGNALRQGPYRSDAIVPFRGGSPWRIAPLTILPNEKAGEGSWTKDPSGSMMLKSGEAGRFVYTFGSPVWSHYHIYAKRVFPPGAARTTYTYVTARAAKALTVDPETTAENDEWIYLGSHVVTAENVNKLVIQRDGGGTEGSLAAGPLLIMIDRRDEPKKSPTPTKAITP